jgi:hypothetical protein
MHAHAFALIGESCLAAIGARIEAQVRAWCSDWWLDESGLEVSCARAWEALHTTARAPGIHASATPAQRSFQGDTGCARVAWQPGTEKSLQHTMFPGGPRPFARVAEDVIATEAGKAALGSLVESVAGLLAGAVEVTIDGEWADACFRRGSGALLVTVSGTIGCDAPRLSFLFDHAAVRTLQAPPASANTKLRKLSLTRALRDVAVTLPVVVGEAEVDLASLAALAVGDVIRLDAPIAMSPQRYG